MTSPAQLSLIAEHLTTTVDTPAIMAVIPVKTAFKVAACAAVGLEYWADHPGASNRGTYVWAIDGDRAPHIVHVRGGGTNRGSAEHVCERAAKRKDGKHRVWRSWSDAGFVGELGRLQHSGYEVVGGVKDSFLRTLIPECQGSDLGAITFIIGAAK